MIRYLPYVNPNSIKNQKGAALIEVLVSIFIVLLIFQLTYISVFSISQTVKSSHTTTASIYAVSLIEAIRAGHIDGGSHQAGPDFMGITRPAGMQARILVSEIEDRPFLAAVQVTVEWEEGRQACQVEMHSIVRKGF